MQVLDAGGKLLGRDVGVQFQRLGGIGEVRGLHMGAHVEILAEEARPDRAQKARRARQRLVGVGHVGDDGDPLDQQRLHPAAPLVRAVEQHGMRDARDVRVVIGEPRTPRQVRGIMARRAAGIGREHVERIARDVILARPADHEGVAVEPRLRRRRGGGVVKDVEGPLPRLGIEGGGTIVPQPPRVEIGPAAVRQGNRQPVVLQRHGVDLCAIHGSPLRCTA